MSQRDLTFHARLMGGAALIVFAAMSTAAAAQEKVYNIAPQPLGPALVEFGAQSGRIVLADGDLTMSKATRGLSGPAAPEAALGRLLDGTGLTYRRSGGSFMIVRAPSRAPSQQQAAAQVVQIEGGSSDVDALIVTAQKREENIQDVPIAISAFSQEDLERSQIAGGPDLITQVPNMTFTKTNFSSYSIQIRGIGTQAISATTDAAVAVAFNNTPFIRNRFFEQEFYDLERVEVLRGPQGTLYGRNATAGVVNIISAKPVFNYEAKLSGDGANYNSTRLEGMVNIPLVEDAVALRLAGAWTKREGFVTNQETGRPIDGRDLWSTRASLRVSPNDRIDANLIWEHFEENDDRLRSGKQLCRKHVVTEVGGNDVPYLQLFPGSQQGLYSGVQATLSQGCERSSLYSPGSFQKPNGISVPFYVPLGAVGLPTALDDPYLSGDQSGDLRVIESTRDPEYRAKADVGELQVSFDLTDTLTLASETAYGRDTVFSTQDFGRFSTASGAWKEIDLPHFDPVNVLTDGPNGLVFCDPQLGCSDRLLVVDLSTAEYRQFSQEFRLSSDYDGPFNFSLGANYLRFEGEDKYYVFINSITLASLTAAQSSITNADPFPPYQAGVTDNGECLPNGPVTSDPTQTYGYGCVYVDPNPIGSLNDQGHNYFLSRNPYKLISYAMFGEAYYNLSENLKVTAGLRWTVDKKDAPRIPSWTLAGATWGYPVREVIEQEWREPTGRLTVDWKPDLGFTDETLIYGSYARGYKAGGANPPPFVALGQDAEYYDAVAASETRPRTFEPEFVNAFELGSKNTLAGGSVTLNLAAFYYDYTNYQISEIVDRSAFNRNFDATVWGLELEADWRALENLRFGLKVGYEKTRIADGESAIDLMDRTAGQEGWVVVRPFPTFASSCILPERIFYEGDELRSVGNVGGGMAGACELAYLVGVDPVTERDYVSDPTVGGSRFAVWNDYPGWDPKSAPNNGEGFSKDLSGNELPNAPNVTATFTVDYSVPLPSNWLMTMHTDLYWQSDSSWRVFDDHEYNRLDEYFTANLAAIFTNEDAGWKVMAYVKNVFDRDSITGAFLNSDDTGLTTNVFLTEPRLYGIRITKDWTGGLLLGSFGQRREGPYLWTVEIGGQAQRHNAPYSAIRPGFSSAFEGELDNFNRAQNQDLDWGNGGDFKLTYRPGGDWTISAGVRFGETNGGDTHVRNDVQLPAKCIFGGPFAAECETEFVQNDPFGFVTKTNWSNASASNREEHEIVDFAVGRDVNFGGLSRSTFELGMRYANLQSSTRLETVGDPHWQIEDGWFLPGDVPVAHTRYESLIEAEREFKGAGPVLSWAASQRLIGDEGAGQVGLDWSVTGGVLFGKQKATFVGSERTSNYVVTDLIAIAAGAWTAPISVVSTPVLVTRSDSVKVPSLDLSLGLSYSVDRFKVGAGYRWERYFDAIDGGHLQHKDADRTIDGPYFKLSVGFGN